MPRPEGSITPIPGARPIRPGDLDGLWSQQKHDEIVKRVKYLVQDDLEEPPHIHKARLILHQRGVHWREVSDKEIFDILDKLPRPLFHFKLWKREPPPPETSEYHDVMTRIHRAELDYYGFDSTSPSGKFLYGIRDAKQDPYPSSFYQRLKQAGVTIDKIVHFTRKVARSSDVRQLSLPYRIDERRELFLADLGRFLAQAQGSRSAVPHSTYRTPSKEDIRYIEDGIMKIDGRTLVVDTTLNNSLLQSIQEADYRPGVIIKEFTFWRDGADQDAEALAKVARTDYATTHWLTQYYDVFQRPPGSGFVTCNPTIYIKKGGSLMQGLKRSASTLVGRASPRS
ncbi:hypothetical protein N658DRAFT_507136 [Parathielavia hyrcaniae]|uniref:Uncharacterized protein n=1 Tax=Parathielavia hyrcaniae TaxID=113614 RepID=A0AAN6Q072_9PEZI|nr:hypothetical protein N658DRAFT_507136 [Parathielavia hyrcaniae]